MRDRRPENLIRDIEIERLRDEQEDHHTYIDDLRALTEDDRRQMLFAGVDAEAKNRAGTYVMKDQSVIHCNVRQPGIEVLSVKQAREKHGWLEKYWWQAVAPDTDRYTQHVRSVEATGYFIRAEAGRQSTFPVQSCLFLQDPEVVQSVHNIIIAEESSELDIITGCTARKSFEAGGAHLGVLEIYVKKNATVTFSMIHNWSEQIQVRPRTVVIVEEGGTFLSNYICMKPVRDVQMNPLTRLTGPGAVARFSTVLLCGPGGSMEIGSRVILEAEDTRTEILSRGITTGGSIIARGTITGLVPNCKGHLECQGLVLNENGRMIAIPELDGRVPGIELSHEAAVGKIAQEEIEYLMARGLSESEAKAVIVRGFLNVEIEGLPPILKAEMDRVVNQLQAEAF